MAEKTQPTPKQSGLLALDEYSGKCIKNQVTAKNIINIPR